MFGLIVVIALLVLLDAILWFLFGMQQVEIWDLRREIRKKNGGQARDPQRAA